ncbi:MAG: WG repeat-containing protein [Flavobacteriaceae bacterium]|nr:WG repeat-containing protein [Flavobacteriaceae bacterium]
MKNAIIFSILCCLFSWSVNSQELSDIEFISPYHDGYAAIKKGTQWAFIDMDGNLAIDFREDLVVGQRNSMACCSKEEVHDYPFFSHGRSMIVSMKKGIPHYGFIDHQGTTVIPAEYVNATAFNGTGALVLEVVKERLGRNEALGKNVVTYSYNELLIDKDGNTITYVRGPYNLLYTKEKMKTPPSINSKFLNENVLAVKSDENSWQIKPLEQK